MNEIDDPEWSIVKDEGFIGLVGPILRHTSTEGRFRFFAEQKHSNRGGYVHGGMLMTFADRALGLTARKDDVHRSQATIQFDASFVRAVRIGELVEIDCRILKQTRSLVFMEGHLSVENEIVASARGIWKIIARGKS